MVSGLVRGEDAESPASLEFYTLVTTGQDEALYSFGRPFSSEGVMQVASPLLDEVLERVSRSFQQKGPRTPLI